MFTRRFSAALFEQARHHIPGGVNSPVRAFGGVGGSPVFFERASGAYLTDVDGKAYIDYVNSWGANIVGHAHPDIVQATQKALLNGLSFGAPTRLESALAAKICQHVPSIARVRFVNSGTEAVMSAIRLARGVTGRAKLLKFKGCYHGHVDSLLVEAGSGNLTFSVPSSAGVPESIAKDTFNATYNDLNSVEQIFKEHGSQIACIIVEPVAANMNCVLPKPGFLQGLRAICDHYKSLLIFDEVITGFRVALQGAQSYYDVMPDITTLGKVIGGGLPVGAYGGKKEIMSQVAPEGPVYQAGTLSGNPIVMAAGLATLNLLEKPGVYTRLSHLSQTLTSGLLARAQRANIPLFVNYIGGLWGLFFTEEMSVSDLAAVKRVNLDRFKKFFHMMLEKGIYLAPSAYESGFVSCAHEDDEIEHTLVCAEQGFAELAKLS